MVFKEILKITALRQKLSLGITQELNIPQVWPVDLHL